MLNHMLMCVEDVLLPKLTRGVFAGFGRVEIELIVQDTYYGTHSSDTLRIKNTMMCDLSSDCVRRLFDNMLGELHFVNRMPFTLASDSKHYCEYISKHAVSNLQLTVIIRPIPLED